MHILLNWRNKMKVVKLFLITVLTIISLFLVGQVCALEEFIPVDLEPHSNTKLGSVYI